MKQMTRRLSLWSACLLALGSTPAWAQQPPSTGPLFIQGSEVNLRDKPATTAKVVGKVAIATACQHVKDAPRQWVRIKCGDVEGFTLKSLVGAQQPTAEALLAQAQDTTLDLRVRLDAATRAATLAPDNEQALKLLSERFFDVSFDQLAKDRETRRRKGGYRETIKVLRKVLFDLPVVKRETGQAGIVRELEKIEFDWHRIEFRDGAFVSAMYRGEALVVHAGYFGSLHWTEIDDADEDFLVSIVSRGSSQVSEVLKRALRQGAREATPDAGKYSEVHQESPDMPALSLEALQLYQSLPDRWYQLSQRPSGKRFLNVGCGLKGAELRVDLYRRASIWWHKVMGPGESNDEVWRVVDISKTATGFQFQLRVLGGFQKTLTLTWPTAEANVAVWELNPHGTPASYLAANRKHRFEVDDTSCSEGP
ncbi:SH3 domain-containing protein [Pyxidicoccus xibeiensis]|uniref:hypothetical protein n=1 Tax=Pyxidicoccus xibeiensis TaxID=2906759 RepID=UPI0020A7DFC5|nr:hypothetical protein [Pyxidicoccus xibeiensis]MCP3142967.1 hypothetical protein [Pyxidicoccus xibeiensis]